MWAILIEADIGMKSTDNLILAVLS
jgi:hypothetical protein